MDELARIVSDLIYLLIYAGRSTDAMQIAERGLERAGADSFAQCRLLASLGLAVTTEGDMRRARLRSSFRWPETTEITIEPFGGRRPCQREWGFVRKC